MLFLDSGLTEALDLGDVFSPEVDARFRGLERLLGQIDPIRSPDEVLNDQSMPAVRKLASELLSDLDSIVS